MTPTKLISQGEMVSDLELCVRALCTGLFDYSGMFPPAALAFEDALKRTSGFPSSLHRPYLLATSIVLEASNIALLSERMLLSAGWQRARTFSIAVLGGTYSTDRIKEVFEAMGSCPPTGDIESRYKSIEWKVASCDDIDRLIAETFDQSRCDFGVLAIEPDLSLPKWEEALERTLLKISPYGEKIALKIRGTGPTAIDNQKIATVIARASEVDVSLKATGGFHHPIIEASKYQNNLGFLNLVVALSIARVLKGDFPLEQIQSCVSEDTISDFEIGKVLRWRNFEIAREAIAPKLSIGSCSIDEPDQDLVRLLCC